MSLLIRRYWPQAVIVLLLISLVGVAAVVLKGTGIVAGQSNDHRPLPVLRYSNEGITDILTLDPARGPDFNSRQAIQLIFGGLVRFGPHFRILPDAAQNWNISKDRRTYTFHLRPNVRFGDGTRMTAADVVHSLNRTLSPQFSQNSGAAFLGDIEGAQEVVAGRSPRASGIQMPDSHTVRIRLLRPSGSFLAKLANPVGYIVPFRRINADPVDWDQHAIGTGPFKVGRWIHNNALFLVPNPYYYAGRVHLDGINMNFVPEDITAYKQYRTGSLDLMGSVHFPTDVHYDVAGNPDFHQSERLETVFLTLNERQRPFNDMRVRQAFAHAVNKAALAQGVYTGFAHPTDGMLPPGLPGYNPGVQGCSYNPRLARQLLAQAGYPGGRGLPHIVYPVDEGAQNVVLANALATQWRSVLGVHIDLVQHGHSAYLTLLSNLAYGIGVIDWTADYPDPENFLTQQFHSGVSNNNGGYSNPAFDRLVDRAAAMSTTDSHRLALYHAAENLAMREAAAIPLVNPSAGILLRHTVHGIAFNGGFVLVPDWSRVTISSGTGS